MSAEKFALDALMDKDAARLRRTVDDRSYSSAPARLRGPGGGGWSWSS